MGTFQTPENVEEEKEWTKSMKRKKQVGMKESSKPLELIHPGLRVPTAQ